MESHHRPTVICLAAKSGFSFSFPMYVDVYSFSLSGPLHRLWPIERPRACGFSPVISSWSPFFSQSVEVGMYHM